MEGAAGKRFSAEQTTYIAEEAYRWSLVGITAVESRKSFIFRVLTFFVAISVRPPNSPPTSGTASSTPGRLRNLSKMTAGGVGAK